MFENLWYKRVDKYSGFVSYELNLNDSNHYEFNYKHCIDFKVRDCSVSLYSKVGNSYGAFNVEDNEIFKAINKQTEELGWLDD